MQKIVHNMKVRNLCASPDVTVALISRNTGLAKHVACVKKL
jgi:hypothetical protein